MFWCTILFWVTFQIFKCFKISLEREHILRLSRLGIETFLNCNIILKEYVHDPSLSLQGDEILGLGPFKCFWRLRLGPKPFHIFRFRRITSKTLTCS